MYIYEVDMKIIRYNGKYHEEKTYIDRQCFQDIKNNEDLVMMEGDIMVEYFHGFDGKHSEPRGEIIFTLKTKKDMECEILESRQPPMMS